MRVSSKVYNNKIIKFNKNIHIAINKEIYLLLFKDSDIAIYTIYNSNNKIKN